MSAEVSAPAERPRIRSILAAVVRDDDLRRVHVAFLAFNMGEYATWLALLVYAYARGGAAEAGFVAVIQLVPAAVVAPFGAYAGDRFRRDRVLFVDYVVQGVTLGLTGLALSVGAPVAVVYGSAIVAASTLTFMRPAHNALLPALTESPSQLTAANVVTGVVQGAGVTIGPVIGGVLIAWSGPGLVFLVFAAAMLVGAALVRRLHADVAALSSGGRMSAMHVVRETFGGVRALRDAPESRVVLLVLSLGIVVLGAMDVLFVAAAIDLLHMGESGPSFLAAAFGVGGVVGAAASAVLVGRPRLTPPLAAGSVLLGAPVAAVAAAPSVATAPLLLGVSGAGWSVADVAGRTLMQRVSPDEVLARIFGIFEGVAMITIAIGSAAASALVETLGIRTALVVAGAFLPVVLLATGRPLLAIDRHAKAPDPHLLELLRGIPIFAPLTPPALERLIANLIRIDAHPDDVVIREGDVGDRFYVIDAGEVQVTMRGRLVGRRGAGEYVGEIALLRDVPRTATVSALTDVTLYALERDVFLSAVTGHPRSHDLAEERIEHDLGQLRGVSGD